PDRTEKKPDSDAVRVLGTEFIVVALIRRYFFRPSLAAAATFDKMSAAVRFKKFHDLGSRDFRRDERALRRETSKRLHPGELLLRFRPGGQLHFSVDHPWFIAQDRHVRGHRRPQGRLQLRGESHPRHPKRRLAAAIGGKPWKRSHGGA